MTSSILLLKVCGSVGAATAVAGGGYVVYKNSDSIKRFFVRKKETQQTTTTEKQTTSNLFVVRYKDSKVSTDTTLSATTPLTCSIDTTEGTPCKIYKFASSTKFDNTITASDIGNLTPVTSTDASFVNNSYLVIEWTGTKKAATDLHNKTFTVKQTNTTLGAFTFDQIIFGEAGKTGGTTVSPIKETYIVKKTASWTNQSDSTSYACKFAKTDSNEDNYDSGCELTKITLKDTTKDKITTLEHLKSLTDKLTTDTLKTDSDNYYKLTVNKNLLYNLTFSESVTPQIQIELVNQANTSIGTVDLKQKLEGSSFIGKTDLLLGKVVKAPSSAVGALTSATCSLSETLPTDEANKIACILHKATETQEKPLQELTLTSTALQATDTVAANNYFVIKFTAEQTISSLKDQEKIYYHIPTTGSDKSVKTIELSIVALMSGEFDGDKKPIFITEPKTTTQISQQ